MTSRHELTEIVELDRMADDGCPNLGESESPG
jgi:hypothetical protein